MQDLEGYVLNLLGIQLQPTQLRALEKYARELLQWNKRINLTAVHDIRQVRVKHFLDSLTCICAMGDKPIERVIDVGTGAGFPGLPLKIVKPEMELTLVESIGKKADFCSHIVKTLKLEGVTVINKRVETIGQMPDHRQKYDWGIARAVAILPVLAEYLLPLIRIGGAMVAMKGESAPAEAHSAEHAINLLGGHLNKLTQVTLPGVVEQRYLITIDKVAASPDAYPRRVGVPTKRPLKLRT